MMCEKTDFDTHVDEEMSEQELQEIAAAGIAEEKAAAIALIGPTTDMGGEMRMQYQLRQDPFSLQSGPVHAKDEDFQES